MIVLSHKMADNLEKFDADSEATKDSVVFDVVDDEPEAPGSHPITESNAPGSLPETRRAIAEMVHDLPDANTYGVHVATEVQNKKKLMLASAF